MRKAPEAFRTISETAEALDTPAHVLRFWESKFTQVKPVKRAGGRRYYRRADIDLLAGIKELLHEQGMTIRGVQKLLHEKGVRHVAGLAPVMDTTLDDTPADRARVQATPARFSVVDAEPDHDTAPARPANTSDPVAPSSAPVPLQRHQPSPAATAPASDTPAPAAKTPDTAPPAEPQRNTTPREPAPPSAPPTAPVPGPATEPRLDITQAPAAPAPARSAIRLAHDIRRSNMHQSVTVDAGRIAPLLARLEQLLARMSSKAEAERPHR
ncbi:MerR family transcriptional regulator [Roseinatronobacter sp. S2]|uniref:MerR family transcriptional regulator n=1 Tax=Roseinatronobacter sp. S2 TaxID=3035471 RepID=UPI00240F0881|nr:MerR family transcriptional regulator [Roseinatronobacter sp. S2]WFE73891.1 MerR family transcriptional regulator [Roseinatronobacter sp. S2]